MMTTTTPTVTVEQDVLTQALVAALAAAKAQVQDPRVLAMIRTKLHEAFCLARSASEAAAAIP